MSLAELRIENLRCIESAVLEFSPELNLIAGENGAGKTSILEAIFLLGRGRSFRTRSSEGSFATTSRSSPYSAAPTIRHPGRLESKSPQTAARAPGSTVRRRLRCSNSRACSRFRPSTLRSTSSSTRGRSVAAAGSTGWCSTWNQAFGVHWARYNRALKQRNAALRGGVGEIAAWDAELIRNGNAITEATAASAQSPGPMPGADL